MKEIVLDGWWRAGPLGCAAAAPAGRGRSSWGCRAPPTALIDTRWARKPGGAAVLHRQDLAEVSKNEFPGIENELADFGVVGPGPRRTLNFMNNRRSASGGGWALVAFPDWGHFWGGAPRSSRAAEVVRWAREENAAARGKVPGARPSLFGAARALPHHPCACSVSRTMSSIDLRGRRRCTWTIADGTCHTVAL